MRARFWIRSSRGTDTSEVVVLPAYVGELPKEKQREEVCYIHERWCRNFGAWHSSENLVTGGFEMLED
jgi:hypothetical protein